MSSVSNIANVLKQNPQSEDPNRAREATEIGTTTKFKVKAVQALPGSVGEILALLSTATAQHASIDFRQLPCMGWLLSVTWNTILFFRPSLSESWSSTQKWRKGKFRVSFPSIVKTESGKVTHTHTYSYTSTLYSMNTYTHRPKMSNPIIPLKAIQNKSSGHSRKPAICL